MYIENGKMPDEPYNATLGFWLPPDSPYGNFQLKYMKIIQRLDEANRKIAESHHFWREWRSEGILPIGALERHVFANEEAIYMLRRAADELVSLVWCLSKYEEDGHYPSKIKVDCLGAVVAQDENARHEAFSPHLELMSNLNDIANAFKHSFINSDHTILGSEEPRIHALGLAYNKLSSEPEFYDVLLTTLIEKYNEFYKSCVSWLESFSERNR
jgi:hypothetical protein